MTFDIAQLDTRTASEAGVEMPILHPRSGIPMVRPDGKLVSITLFGPNSEPFRKQQRLVQLRRADYAARGVKMEEGDFERERQDFLVVLTKDWTFESMDGQPFAFSPDNARRFYADKRWDWVTAAVWRFVNEDGNFLPSS